MVVLHVILLGILLFKEEGVRVLIILMVISLATNWDNSLSRVAQTTTSLHIIDEDFYLLLNFETYHFKASSQSLGGVPQASSMLS